MASMAAAAAVGRLKEGADAVLRAALEQRGRPPSAQMPQAEQERLAAAALAAARDVDDVFERAKLARTAETEDEVKREVRRTSWGGVGGEPDVHMASGCICFAACVRACVRARARARAMCVCTPVPDAPAR